MHALKQVLRSNRILRVIFQHGLDELIPEANGNYKKLRALRWVRACYFFDRNRFKELNRGERLCRALTTLGPIFVKFGQMLSTRRDIIPFDIADELAKLQDQVPPFDGQLAKAIIETNLNIDLAELCPDFDTEALASASIAQVHAGTLNNGDKVVFKVLRPNIAAKIKKDLELLHFVASLVRRYVPGSARLKPEEVVADYEHTIKDELNLLGEAANASQLKRNFANSDLVYVPEIYWDYCTEQVMVSERIHGIPIRDNAELDRQGVNRKVLAEKGVEIFFTQVFRDNFFHADMHPGNIFVDATNPDNPSYIAIDCGIVGTLDADDQRYLAENFIAFFNRDYQKVAQLHVDSGWVPASTNVKSFESAIRTACEPIFGKPLAEISFGLFLLRLFQTAQRFNMEVQPQLILLQKTFFYIEGLGRELYPELDLWATAKPFLENWMKDRLSVRTLWQEVKEEYPLWREKAPEMLRLVYQYLRQSETQKSQLDLLLSIKNQDVKLEKQRHRSLFAAVFTVSASLLLLADFSYPVKVALAISVVGGLTILWKSKPKCD